MMMQGGGGVQMGMNQQMPLMNNQMSQMPMGQMQNNMMG